LGILSEFERRLEGAIEGIFTKAFRTGLQPVEMAKRILKEMESNKTVGVKEVWVPNGFLFALSPADRERFQQSEKVLRRELEQVVREGARERGWGLVGPPEVQFETDPSLREGRFTCQALLIEGEFGPEPAPEPTPAAPGRAELVLIEDGQISKVYPLERERVIIGRLGESDIVLSDPGTSRRHAEVRQEDGRFVLQDLGSTNGTLVNEEAVEERTLEEGDRIGIGQAVLQFRRR
jgi:hypothetical protein